MIVCVRDRERGGEREREKYHTGWSTMEESGARRVDPAGGELRRVDPAVTTTSFSGSGAGNRSKALVGVREG